MGLTLRQLRLRAVWLLVLPFFFLARPTPRLLLLGGIVAAIGTAIRAWAAGTIRKERTLITSGPYAHTRNPLYLGSFLIGIGATIAGGRWEFIVLFLAFYVVVYGRTMRAEAELLAERFGERHAEYARNVPLFVPRPIPWRAPESPADSPDERFALHRWRRNREYQALLGVAAAFAVLAAKLWWG